MAFVLVIIEVVTLLATLPTLVTFVEAFQNNAVGLAIQTGDGFTFLFIVRFMPWIFPIIFLIATVLWLATKPVDRPEDDQIIPYDKIRRL